MTTNSETRAVQDFLLSNPDHLTVARAVYESWPEIKYHVCRRFLERLHSRIERKMEADGNLHHSIGDMRVGFQYVGEKANENQIWLYRTAGSNTKKQIMNSVERPFCWRPMERVRAIGTLAWRFRSPSGK